MLDFVATVVYNTTTHVTRKQGSSAACLSSAGVGVESGGGATNSEGTLPAHEHCFSFGGWAGLSPAQHTITVNASGYAIKVVDLQVVSGTTTHLTIPMSKAGPVPRLEVW